MLPPALFPAPPRRPPDAVAWPAGGALASGLGGDRGAGRRRTGQRTENVAGLLRSDSLLVFPTSRSAGMVARLPGSTSGHRLLLTRATPPAPWSCPQANQSEERQHEDRSLLHVHVAQRDAADDPRLRPPRRGHGPRLGLDGRACRPVRQADLRLSRIEGRTHSRAAGRRHAGRDRHLRVPGGGDQHAPARNRRRPRAAAQSDLHRQGDLHARLAERRSHRFRHRCRLEQGGSRDLRLPVGGSRRALRRVPRGHAATVDRAGRSTSRASG